MNLQQHLDTIRARDAWDLLKHLDALEQAVAEYNNAPTTMMVPENNMQQVHVTDRRQQYRDICR